MLIIFVDGMIFMFVGFIWCIICMCSVDGWFLIKFIISFLGFDFYMFVICDLCNVLFYFMFFEICLCWIKFLYLNYIVWNVMILLDDNVNWLFFYFFFCGERCNSDVNIVNGKIKYDVI